MMPKKGSYCNQRDQRKPQYPLKSQVTKGRRNDT
jgi:hypothetical protein